MHVSLPVARVLGLGAPEHLVVLILLLVLLSGGVELGGRGASDPRLTRHEKMILVVLGVITAASIGFTVWPQFAV